jgi:hypothetical protein
LVLVRFIGREAELDLLRVMWRKTERALLSDALDKRRGRGQQQITVRHVTVNADQATPKPFSQIHGFLK